MAYGLQVHKKTALLVLTDTFVGHGGGGAERHLQLVLEGLPKDEFDITCIEFIDKQNIPSGRIHEVSIIRRPLGPLISPMGFRTILYLRELCRRKGTTVILSFFEKSDILAVLLRIMLPKVRLISSRRDTGFRYSRTMRVFYRAINPVFSRLVVPSAAVYESLIENSVPSSRITIIRNAAKGAKLVTKEDRLLRRRGCGFDEGDFIVITVGSLKTVKNQAMLLAAAAEMRRLYGTIPHIVMVGSGPDLEMLQTRAAELGLSSHVRFVGHLSSGVDRWLSIADVFALPSLTEGLSNALLEAQALGLPAIVTEVGGNPEVVTDGKSGFLVPVGDVALLASRMHALQQDASLRRAMAKNAVERVYGAFSLRAMIAGYRTVLRG